MKARLALALVAVSGAACVETAQNRTGVPLLVAGTDTPQAVIAVGEVPITIARADLAFGPLYLCAGATAGALCDTARLEWLEAVVVDTTAAEPKPAGTLVGTTGNVQSWMYDLGISSQLARAEPFVLEAAQELGGASLVVAGSALVEAIELPFVASVPIQQTEDTEPGVPVVRKSTSDPFFRDIGVGETGLVVRFDPAVWVRALDFRPYVAADVCAPTAPAIVCDGTLERRCKGDTELSNRDCSELEQVCLPDQGCAERLSIEPGTEAYRSLRNAIVSGRRPSFEWTSPL